MSGSEPEDTTALFDGFAEHVHPGKVALFRELGIELVMGGRDGARFQDVATGRWFYNCHSNGGVYNLGHRHPEVVAALRRALHGLDIGNHHLVSKWRLEAAEKLAATTGDLLPGVVFTASGSEAVDAAVKLARGFTRRRRIVTVVGGFHGCTGLGIAAGDQGQRDRYLLDLPDFVHVPYDDAEALRAAVDERTAAVILEPIPATLGFPPPSPGYLAAAEAACRSAGALFVLDEVQTGLGRTGSWWYHQQEGVTPDAVITGKGLSGGLYPVAALLVAREPFEWFASDFMAHLSTFGGSELGCVVASAVCDVVGAPGFLDHVKALAGRFADRFADAPFGLRQRGLTMGIETGVEGGAYDALARLLEVGVFAFPAGFDPSVVQFKPPLILTFEEADDIADRVRRALG